jgi:cysteinyl-tRNA synthetase
MAWKHLGEQFDIHGGGIDLVFPHHENELAQTCCVFHESRMANVWMHNGFLQVEGAKMSKSEGNFVTVRELLADWPDEVLRFNMLRTHYRSPMDWTVRGLEESYNVLGSLTDWPEFLQGSEEQFSSSIMEALCDDLNAPKAISELHAIYRSGNFKLLGPTLRALGFSSPLKRKRKVDEEKVKVLVATRINARSTKNFKESDRIRDELTTMGVVLKDGKDPATGEPTTTWEIAR